MGTTEITIIVVALVAVGGGIFWWSRTREAGEEETYHFRCPGCRRRLRYREKQVGHKGMCSNCGQELIFPPLSKALKE
jgi:hypothetical protein